MKCLHLLPLAALCLMPAAALSQTVPELFPNRLLLPSTTSIDQILVPPELGGKIGLLLPQGPDSTSHKSIHALGLVEKQLTLLSGDIDVILETPANPVVVTADGNWVVFHGFADRTVPPSQTASPQHVLVAASPHAPIFIELNRLPTGEYQEFGYFTPAPHGSGIYVSAENGEEHLIHYLDVSSVSVAPVLPEIADTGSYFVISPDGQRMLRFFGAPLDPETDDQPVDLAVVDLEGESIDYLTVEGDATASVTLRTLGFAFNEQMTYGVGAALPPRVGIGPTTFLMYRANVGQPPYSLHRMSLVSNRLRTGDVQFLANQVTAVVRAYEGPFVESNEVAALYTVSAATGIALVLPTTGRDVHDFKVSPDGTWVAFRASIIGDPGRNLLFAIRPGGVSQHVAPPIGIPSNAPIDAYDFSPDGQYLVALTEELPLPGRLPAPSFPPRTLYSVRVGDTSISESRALAGYRTDRIQGDSFAISPLSDKVAFAGTMNHLGIQVYTVGIEGNPEDPQTGGPYTLVSNPEHFSDPLESFRYQWLPSGNLLVAEYDQSAD